MLSPEVLTLKQQQLERQAQEKKYRKSGRTGSSSSRAGCAQQLHCHPRGANGRKPKPNQSASGRWRHNLRQKDAELAKQANRRKAYHKEITDGAVKRTLELNEEESLLIDARIA